MSEERAIKFYEKLNLEEYDGMIIMERQEFYEILKEEFEAFERDTLAEVGMGLNMIISKGRNEISDSLILDAIIKVCNNLIDTSPECALEFIKTVRK